MDRDSSSPEKESNERAGSSDPCSIRPNPFKDGDESSRKRRRTSLNVDSRSRSVESNQASPSSYTAASPDTAEDTTVEDMKVDDGAPLVQPRPQPRTPEHNPQQPPATTPSHVTLRLRNSARHTLDTIPSSPPGGASLSSSPTPSQQPLDKDSKTLESEIPELELISESNNHINAMDPSQARVPGGFPTATEGTEGDAKSSEIVAAVSAAAGESIPSSPSPYDSTSPPIEIVDDLDDDDNDGLETVEASVMLLPGVGESIQESVMVDPTSDFPYYQNSREPPLEHMLRLANFLTTDSNVAKDLQNWIDRYLLFAKHSSFETIYRSHMQFRPLWLTFPKVVSEAPELRNPGFGAATLDLRLKVTSFCASFARLAAHFVEFDCKVLEHFGSSENSQAQELVCPPFLSALTSITDREPLPDEDRLEIPYEPDDISDILDGFINNYRVPPCGTLALLKRLLDSQTLFVPSPQTVDNCSNICVMATFLSREAYRKMLYSSLTPQATSVQSSRIALGQSIFAIAAPALDNTIANHITYLNRDRASQQISSLGDLVYIHLKVNQQEAINLAATIADRHPIPLEYIPDAFAMKWRFEIFCGLIKNSQMKLRLMAVESLCKELVNCWKRYGDLAPEPLREYSVTTFVADVLSDTGVVAYLLGPTCHPEITTGSFNIIGFLAVSQTYTNAHTDLFWQTVITTQDPRISDALIRTVGLIVMFFTYDVAVYFSRRFLDVAIPVFTAPMRHLCEALLRQVCSSSTKTPTSLDTFIPFQVCLRLLRESSVPGDNGMVKFPDVQSFAIEKLKECLVEVGDIDDDQRRSLYRTCISDLTLKTKTTLGSICAILIINGYCDGRDLAFLASEHDLAKLIVDDLENAVEKSRQLPNPTAVLSGPANGPRRDMLFQLIVGHSSTLTPELSSCLWDMMAGASSVCDADRHASWAIINACAKRIVQRNNPFLLQCLGEFIPRLPSYCFCGGLLDFLRERLLSALSSPTCDLLAVEAENEKAIENGTGDNRPANSVNGIALEQVWRIVLTTPFGTIERPATHFLVKEVYIDSSSIRSYSSHKARTIHLALVNRCLRQLSSAAGKLKLLAEDTIDSSAVADFDALVREQELLFLRSVQVLQHFLRQYRASSQAASPDQHELVLNGEPAELKYQSFDGDNQTEVRPLSIGRLNTAASLLESLKEATGFDKYKVYYRGQAFEPQESEISQSLEDLHIYSGLILVKRDVPPGTKPLEPIASASHIETAILDQFQQLWDYLSLKEALASEVYELLVHLSVGHKMFRLFERSGLSHKDVLYKSQPYKSLYALHALRDFLVTRHRADQEAATVTKIEMTTAAPPSSDEAADVNMQMPEEAMEGIAEGEPTLTSVGGTSPSKEVDMDTEDNAKLDEADTASSPSLSSNSRRPSSTTTAATYESALAIAINLVTGAICDPSMTEVPSNANLQIELYVKLLQPLDFVLAGDVDNDTIIKNLNANLLGHLLDILSVALDYGPTKSATHLVKLAFRTITDTCSLNREFWLAFKSHPKTRDLIERLLLTDERLTVRQLAETQIGNKVVSGQGPSAVSVFEFRDFFWPVILGLVPKAMCEPMKCEGIFNLIDGCFGQMVESKPFTLDVATLLRETGSLLLSYTTLEDATQPECVDYAMYGLTRMFESVYRASQNLDLVDVLSPNFASKLFWTHLFPPWQDSRDTDVPTTFISQKPYPHIVQHSKTRVLLMKIILDLVDDDSSQLPLLVRNLDQLVPCEPTEEDGESYHYELPQVFDRTKALRSPCGYVGLKNLSNTCYFNSLLTQLFMNVKFRRFMVNVDIDNEDGESLLFQTRLLFSFLQNSIRRYVDTHSCINAVKSYEDGPIDIHNQMDVDEFYNLLFDRWEGQMSSPGDKKELRSFYGGQIVQQMRSEECEHVSERLEPFSAIQCDIKGKSTLQESLEAYVEGEIMEGDNKYNCSDCNRHVVATKRACLKDIPDSLIFHLKRFEFNLRNGTRNKINDYFSFPREINMRPYTIDQLSNQSEEQPADIFELVGVLVHSGTAESGHYYSYIRERPTPKSHESWVEFNDDMVSTWDPSLLEPLCFGGTETRSNLHYGNDGNDYIDRSYSAYMLFYQRRSSLVGEQDALATSGVTGPGKVPIPEKLADHIQSENSSFVRRHAIFDPQHLPFVSKVLSQVQFSRPGSKCSASHVVENRATQMVISHLDQVASRTKDLPDFQTLLNGVSTMGRNCGACALAIFDYFAGRPEIFHQMIQRCLEPDVRLDMGSLVIEALHSIRNAFADSYFSTPIDDPTKNSEDNSSDNDEDDDAKGDFVNEVAARSGDGGVANGISAIEKDPYARDPMELVRTCTILTSAQAMIRTLWDHIHILLRSWPETFAFMQAFISLGREELGVFLDMGGFRRALLVISADNNLPQDVQIARLLAALHRRGATRPPSYENIIALINIALVGMYPDRATARPNGAPLYVDDNMSRFLMAMQDSEGDLPMSRTEFTLMSRDWAPEFSNFVCNVFVDKLIGINQHPIATDAIVVRLMATHAAMEAKIYATLKVNITANVTKVSQGPYLRTAVAFIRNARSAEFAFQLLNHIAEQCRNLANIEGRLFFETLRDLFHGETGITTHLDIPALLQGLRCLHIWAPGLLCYYDLTVNHDVELFLQENLFNYGVDPEFDDSQGGAERARFMKLAAKKLGVECLRHIHLNFIQANVRISSSTVASFQRLMAECAPYYVPRSDGTEDALSLEFKRLNNTIPDLLRVLVVDDNEEDGSVGDDPDWNDSSEPEDSLGNISMQTAGELNDIDMP